MKAMVLHDLNGPDSMSYEDWPEPEPGPGEVLVKLKAAALNRRDVFVTQGQYPGAKPEALPVILGSDGSGELVAIGNGVEGVIEGTPPVNSDVVIHPSLYWGDDIRIPGKDYRILGLPENGTYAQYVKVPAENVFRKPAHLLHDEAAALPLAALTAYRALVTRGGVQEGETVLIPGIGGGVATFLVQLAVALNARVFVTSSSDEKIESAKRELGAEDGINYGSEGWQKELRKMSGGIDVSVDSIGGDVFDALATLANPAGRIVTFGATRGPVPNLVMPKVFLKQLDILGTAMGSAQEFEEMLKLYEDRGLKPKVDSSHPLEEAASAHKRMEAGENFGKIVLNIPE